MAFSQLFNNHRILKRLAKALIRLRICAGWSEALLVAHTTLLEISCTGSIFIRKWPINCDMQTPEPCNFCHVVYFYLTHHCTLKPCYALMILSMIIFLVKEPGSCTNVWDVRNNGYIFKLYNIGKNIKWSKTFLPSIYVLEQHVHCTFPPAWYISVVIYSFCNDWLKTKIT